MRLTRDERADLFHGRFPRIVRKAEKAPCEPGERIELSGSVSITVTAVKRTKAGEWRVDYRVKDDRPRYPRRVPPVFEVPELDDEGRPLPPSEDSIQNARFDGSYTSSRNAAVPDTDDGVDDETLTRFTKEARVRFEERRNKEELARKQARQFAATVREAAIQTARRGGDPSVVFARAQKALSEVTDLQDEEAA